MKKRTRVICAILVIALLLGTVVGVVISIASM